jgi:hypothetical protein
MSTAAELAHRQAIVAGQWMLFRRKFRPPDDHVLKAKRSIQKAFGNRTRGLSILQTDLSEELKREGNGAAAIQWALFDLVRAELLLVKPPQRAKLEDGYKPDWSICAVDNAWKWTPNQLKKEFDPDKAPPLVVAPKQGRLTVAKWIELGIGILTRDGDPEYFGIAPRPDNHDVFPIESAKELYLPGQQWRVLLNLLAKSDYGNSAKKDDVLFELGMLDRDAFSRSRLADSGRAYAEGLTVTRDEERRKLTGIIGDLARKLRKQVSGPDCKGARPVLSVDSKDYVESLFMVRYLVAGDDRNLRFGEAR